MDAAGMRSRLVGVSQVFLLTNMQDHLQFLPDSTLCMYSCSPWRR